MKYFQLYDENASVSYRLKILAGPVDDEDLFDTQVLRSTRMNDLETHYGVHDVAFDNTLLFGFTSYEWTDLDGLTADWAAWLTELGFTVGEWSLTQNQS